MPGVTIATEGLTVEVGGDGSSAPKRILNNVKLAILPGRVYAVMGPSGSGKTTLLNVMAGRTRGDFHTSEAPGKALTKRNMRITGKMYLNGNIATGAFVRTHSKYVMQRDELMPFLTVHETITFAARLKLRYLSAKVVQDRVEQVIQELGLESCRDVLIGNQIRKGISGGQKKRVSIALELLDDPPLIFLDEPTSGLDSSLAFDVVKILRRMAQKGRTIVATIHQPRSQIYAMFDDLLLLSQGRIVYQGPAAEATKFMKEQGYVCPPTFNASDFLLDLLTLEGKTELTPSEVQKPVSRTFSALLASRESLISDATKGADAGGAERTSPQQHDIPPPPPSGGNSLMPPTPILYQADESGEGRVFITPEELEKLPQQYEESEYARRVDAQVTKILLSAHTMDPSAPVTCGQRTQHYWYSVVTLLERHLRDRSRNPGSVFLINMVAVLLSLVAGLTWFRVKHPTTSDDCVDFFNIMGAMVFTALQLSFGVMAYVIDFPTERPLFNREVASGMYTPSAFYIAKNIGDFPFYFLTIILHFVVVYWLVDYGRDAGTTIFYFLTALVNAITAISYIMLAAMLAPTPIAVAVAGPIGIVLCSLASGFWISESALPAFWSVFKYISWIKYTLNAIELKLFAGTGIVQACTQVDESISPWSPLGWSLLVGLAFRLLGYLGLRFTNRRVGLES